MFQLTTKILFVVTLSVIKLLIEAMSSETLFSMPSGATRSEATSVKMSLNVSIKQPASIDNTSLTENAMLNIVFMDSRAILLTPYAESMLDILLYPEFTMDPPWLGLDKIFQNKGS